MLITNTVTMQQTMEMMKEAIISAEVSEESEIVHIPHTTKVEWDRVCGAM